MNKKLMCIVFDGPPSHESGRFVEVEDQDGKGQRVGEWREREDGLWSLDIPDHKAEAAALRVKLADVLQILEAPNMRELQEIYRLTIKSARRLLAANSAEPRGTCNDGHDFEEWRPVRDSGHLFARRSCRSDNCEKTEFKQRESGGRWSIVSAEPCGTCKGEKCLPYGKTVDGCMVTFTKPCPDCAGGSDET